MIVLHLAHALDDFFLWVCSFIRLRIVVSKWNADNGIRHLSRLAALGTLELSRLPLVGHRQRVLNHRVHWRLDLHLILDLLLTERKVEWHVLHLGLLRCFASSLDAHFQIAWVLSRVQRALRWLLVWQLGDDLHVSVAWHAWQVRGAGQERLWVHAHDLVAHHDRVLLLQSHHLLPWLVAQNVWTVQGDTALQLSWYLSGQLGHQWVVDSMQQVVVHWLTHHHPRLLTSQLARLQILVWGIHKLLLLQ